MLMIKEAMDICSRLMAEKMRLTGLIDGMRRTAAELQGRIDAMQHKLAAAGAGKKQQYDDELLKGIMAVQTQTGRSVDCIADRMWETQRTTQFLLSENALLRSRQAERQQLAREMHAQREFGLAKGVDALSMQVGHVVRQQAAVIAALGAFSVSFDQPPPPICPAAWANNDDDKEYNEIMGMLRQQQQLQQRQAAATAAEGQQNDTSDAD